MGAPMEACRPPFQSARAWSLGARSPITQDPSKALEFPCRITPLSVSAEDSRARGGQAKGVE